MSERLIDLIEMAKRNDANVEVLIRAAYWRGLRAGIDHAKERAIEAIKNER